MKLFDKDKIVYLDNHIVVVYKVAGLLTQKDDTGAPNLEDLVKEHLKELFQKPGAVFLHPVHRLDKGVKGLVLFARTSKALSRLNQMLREHKIKRVYLGWVEGILEKKEGKLQHFLHHGSHKSEVSLDGKEAILHYKVLQEKKDRSLLEIELETGRYHQIRAQLSAIHHPLIGDKKYGSNIPAPEIELCHARLEFIHPVTHDLKIFSTSL